MTEIHQCNFQDKILEIVENQGRTLQMLSDMKDDLNIALKNQKEQQKEINALNAFKKNIVGSATILGCLFAFIFNFIGNMFQGGFDWLIHK